jgi:hypothetical protein
MSHLKKELGPHGCTTELLRNAGTQVYAPCHRSEWLSKITEAGVRRRAEHYYQQLDALQTLRQKILPHFTACPRIFGH